MRFVTHDKAFVSVSMSEKSKNLFEDLGKPTLRGVRKCPKCGTFNGTRGLSCKNKDCGQIFKLGKEKKKPEPESDAVQIISSSPLQIYSVKLSTLPDDSRCFVHLPLIEGIESLQDEAEISIIKQSAATCYAPGCVKPIEDTGALQLNLNPCNHTLSVVSCITQATPMILKKVALKAMPASEIVKEQICSFVTRPEEMLVQRVTKNTLVVKCIPDDLHPLGYLHFSVYEPAKSSRKFRVLCDCQPQLVKPIVPREKQMCLHFYMCICAFASDSKLLEEFKPLIQSVFTPKVPGNIAVGFQLTEFDAELNDLRDFFIDDIYPAAKRKKPIILTEVQDTMPSITFDDWLASVTERINQTMHYQFDGHPDPLTFLVPQSFFDILLKRLSVGSKKKRLPNSVVGFNSKDSRPTGVFTRYSWEFKNIIHVKRIFDTPLVPLEITRSFIENRDGTFVPYQPIKDDEEDLAQNFRKTLNNLLIKPLELKTFMKVGVMTLGQKDPTPFRVEWIPDILPKTRMGELKIMFQYGHQRNGIVEHRPHVVTANSSKTPDL